MRGKDTRGARERKLFSPGAKQALAVVAALALLGVSPARAERTHLKPGWNMFSPAQDVEIGRQVSRDAERQLPLLRNARVDNYVNSLGQRLAARAPGERYPYQFKVVNDGAINAFALPGGLVYVNRGVIEAADDEAQLAGVIAHEISHVALRHGTNQASKAYAAQVPLAILGGALGSGSLGSVLTQLGASFALNSVFLKYSRDAERQADVLGTQILYDSNYDPRAMAQFFEKIEAESKGGRSAEFFSSHPSPEHRLERVNEEVDRLGGPPRNYTSDSPEFREIKRYVQTLPPPPKGVKTRPRGDGRPSRPEPPSNRYATFSNDVFEIQHPANWRAYQQGNAVTFVPENGVANDGRGNAALAFGMMVNIYEPHNDRAGEVTLEEATDQLLDELRHSNPAMRVVRRHERVRIGGERGLSTQLVNASPVGGREYDWLMTVLRPEGLLYFVGVAPESDFDAYDRAFETMLDSVRFRR